MSGERQGDVAGTELYFFLSYAHNNSNGPGKSADPDTWVEKFFGDVCDRIRSLEHLSPDRRVGFMDRELGLGHHWPRELSRALSTSRVFVPLYSRRYFESEHCGKEWYAFRDRVLNQAPSATDRVEEIVPALWVPVNSSKIPAAEEIKFDHAAFGDFYAEKGIYLLIKLSRYREQYRQVVDGLARQIIGVCRRSQAQPQARMAYESLPSAFGTAVPPLAGDVPLRITVAAPHAGRMPTGRTQGNYGVKAQDWNPYDATSAYGLAEYVANLARSLGYRPYVADLCDREAEFFDDGPPSGPELLLVDPWASAQEDFVALLQKFDALDKPWVQVVVPWSERDEESALAAEELRSSLDLVLRQKLAAGRVVSSLAVRGVPSLEELVSVLPTVIKTAKDNYLKYVPTSPPMGRPSERQRLAFLTEPTSETETVGAAR
jgi:FxsC-like protein